MHRWAWLILLLWVVLPSGALAQSFEQRDYSISSEESYSHNSYDDDKEDYRTLYWHDDIRLSAGFPGGVSLVALQGIFVALVAESGIGINDYFSPSTTYIHPITLEYNHSLNNWIMLGAKLNFTAAYKSVHDESSGKQIGTMGNYLVGGMVNARFEYLHRESVQLYSSAALGGGIRFMPEFTIFVPMIDWSYFGVAFGKNVFGFVEIGGGMGGSLRVGIGGRF